jgi:uncharacterized membrane protein YkvA (DUF1232 family)
VTEPTWRPLFRTPKATVTTVLRSPAFVASREQAAVIIEDPSALRALGDSVALIEMHDAPLLAVADRVTAAVRFVSAKAAELDRGLALSADDRLAPTDEVLQRPTTASKAARERLVVAALHYLITKDDLVPDFRVGGYLDDVMVLSWIFGAAAEEISPFLDDASDERS